MKIIKFLFWLLWQIAGPIVLVPLCCIFIVLIYPLFWIKHKWGVFNGKREDWMGAMDYWYVKD